MAVPKRRKSSSVTGMGQANKGKKLSAFKRCTKCYAQIKAHYSCIC